MSEPAYEIIYGDGEGTVQEQCAANTQSGARCQNTVEFRTEPPLFAQTGGMIVFCGVHRDGVNRG